MSPLDRRSFLSQGLAAAVVGGLPLVSWAAETAQKPGPASPPPEADAALANEPWRLALERMKAENKPGVVFLLPADAGQAAKLATQLQAWLGDGTVVPAKVARLFLSFDQKKLPGCQVVEKPPVPKDPAVRQLLTQAVFACARRRPDDRDQPEDAAVLLLGPDGKAVAALTAKELEANWTDGLTRLLDGDRGERLAERCRAERQALGEAAAKKVAAAIAALDSDEFDEREAAQAYLTPVAPKITALLALGLKGEPGLEKRRRIEQFFVTIYEDATASKPAALLPYGARWQLKERDACPGCGLGSAPPPARKFLALLTQPTAPQA